ncbi:helix-turn-helix domain-containing protein, partial [Bacillus wiedmannii]|uniref:helix-turn-helix domain-containing protein n=1 Tax=Bacillus wiedmannii TaxID=1890302 RepID=UPI001DAAEE4D
RTMNYKNYSELLKLQSYFVSRFMFFQTLQQNPIDLLRSGNSNVTETAFAVGYNNVSHFSELFRKKYGMNPSKLLRIY